MSSQALGQDGKQRLDRLQAKAATAAQTLLLRVQRKDWRLATWILSITAAFWLLAWLLDAVIIGPLLSSPVGILVSFYGLGAAVLISMLAVGFALWLIISNLGYERLFLYSDEAYDDED